ncbi:MAG: hypothetical protein J0I72_07820 [Stenotrophomonas sp.]|jgi:hypothetical protein|nr:hypothetical protein [Xanthomonadales bacterium]MBN8769233.1 hypothetical protein [Stenotrophomonas sp.]
MKTATSFLILGIPALFLAMNAPAHDPKEHMKEAQQKPDCAAMKGMDHSKMDMNDPVMQAMMQKCMKDMHQDSSASNGTHAKHQQQSEKAEQSKPPRNAHEK